MLLRMYRADICRQTEKTTRYERPQSETLVIRSHNRFHGTVTLSLFCTVLNYK
jgi:hypothetical protein